MQDAQFEVPEDTYQATFETEAEGWTNVFIPWHEFGARCCCAPCCSAAAAAAKLPP